MSDLDFDASEVYDVSVPAGISVGAESDTFRFDIGHTDGAEVFVDEVWNAQVALVTKHPTDEIGGVDRYEHLTTLGPEAARTLGETLVRAAEMAEAQRGDRQ